MLTNLPQEQLVLLGKTVSARRMIDQARYTLHQVSIDPSVQSRLGPAFLAEAQAAVESLQAALRERLGARVSAVGSTAAQMQILQQASRYRRALLEELASARRRGVVVPVQDVQSGGFTSNPSVLAHDLERILQIAAPIAAALSDVGVPECFLDEGKAFVTRLRDSEEQQEVAKRTLQKAAVARKRELTGVVHEAVKTIVSMAKSVHRDRPVAAAEYNLDVLRGVSAPSKAPSPPASPPASAA